MVYNGDARLWTFAPAGLTLNEPVRLTLDVDIEAGAFYGADHISGGQVENLDVEVDADDESGRITRLSAEIDHFSSISILEISQVGIVGFVTTTWDLEAQDTQDPSLGSVLFFVPRAANGCGDGPTGDSSFGPRPGGNC